MSVFSIKSLLFIVLMVLTIPAEAQNIKQFNCLGLEKNTSSELRATIENTIREIDDHKKKGKLKTRFEGLIPLVFHIVLNEERDSISFKQIEKQIEVLNECFSMQNDDLARLDPQFRNAIDYTGPLFCLAYKMENGKKIAAIEYKRVNDENFGDKTNSAGYSSIKYEQLGGFDAWDNEKYLNIWIGDLEFAQGKSTFPTTDPDVQRGIIIDPDYFGVYDQSSTFYPYHLGKTLVHELGHFFGLLHPWGLSASCQDDDGIADTPTQEFIYTGCPSETPYSCGSADMHMNFMNFTNDDCLVHFTTQQMESVWASIDLFYPNLASSINCYESFDEDSVLDQVAIQYYNEKKKITLELPFISPMDIEVSIFQIDGKEVFSKSLFLERYEEFDLNGLHTGIYILFLQSEDNFRGMKLLVY